MIKVLVVDDSAVARESLVYLINAAPGMTVIGTANDGLEAVDAVHRLRPDIITMDIIMPRLSGPEAIDRIMQTAPTPIIVVTGNTITEEVRATFESLDSGALAIVPRPYGLGSDNHEESAARLLQTLRLMAEVKVVRRIPRRSPRLGALRRGLESSAHSFRIVGIGASTGGPSALKTVLTELRADFPVPILVVQHIAPGFVEGFAAWLRDAAALPVRLAVDGERLAPATIYIAPDGAHLGVTREERIALVPPRERTPICPAATFLFDSLADVFGPQAIGVLLTGMGRDGADGLLKMKRAGATTIVQDKETSVVHGMPAEAIALGAADFVLPPPRIGEILMTFATAAYPMVK